MTAMAFVTRAWHVLALRAIQGLFAGYGSLSVAMAAESAPRDKMPSAIGPTPVTPSCAMKRGRNGITSVKPVKPTNEAAVTAI
jgi:hypothetical protein